MFDAIAPVLDFAMATAVCCVPCAVADVFVHIRTHHTPKGSTMSDLYDPAASYSTDVLLDSPEDYYENLLPGEVEDVTDYDVLDFDPYEEWSDEELAYYSTDDELSELLWPGVDYDQDAPF